MWSDGSAEGGVTAGGSGAVVALPSGQELQLRAPAGRVCSSTRAEMVALREALEAVLRLADDEVGERDIVVCTD